MLGLNGMLGNGGNGTNVGGGYGQSGYDQSNRERDDYGNSRSRKNSRDDYDDYDDSENYNDNRKRSRGNGFDRDSEDSYSGNGKYVANGNMGTTFNNQNNNVINTNGGAFDGQPNTTNAYNTNVSAPERPRKNLKSSKSKGKQDYAIKKILPKPKTVKTYYEDSGAYNINSMPVDYYEPKRYIKKCYIKFFEF